MKKSILLLILVISMLATLVSCGSNDIDDDITSNKKTTTVADGQKNDPDKDSKDNNDEEYNKKASQGLSFKSNGDGTCCVSEIGSCTDTDIVIPTKSPDGENVTSIRNYAFSSCESLKSITIPDSVTSIGTSAFYNCTSLASITIPDSVTSISSYVFQSCTSLKKVYYTGDVESWLKISFNDLASNPCTYGADLYFNNELVTEVDVPDTITKIGSYAFWHTNLTSITIPDSVTGISDSAFKYTAYYNNDENWTDEVLYIGNHLIDVKSSIPGAYTIKDGTKCIANYAFEDCTSLTSVTIPNSMTSIGTGAFKGCTSLTNITIPDSVTSISSYVLQGCMSLRKVYYGGTAEQWSEISIDSYGSDSLTSATRYYFSETQPTEEGNFWHYVDGVVTEW